MTVVPTSTVFFRPSLSPSQNAAHAPKKQPTSYIAVTVPRSEVFSGPLRFSVFRKSSVTITPPKLDSIRSQGALLLLQPHTEHALIIAKERHVGGTGHGDPERQPSSFEAKVRHPDDGLEGTSLMSHQITQSRGQWHTMQHTQQFGNPK